MTKSTSTIIERAHLQLLALDLSYVILVQI